MANDTHLVLCVDDEVVGLRVRKILLERAGYQVLTAADGYSGPDVSSPALLREYKNVLADYTAQTQRPLNHVRDFFDCIRSRRPTVANPDVMCRSMNICLAADICEQLKRNLKFDLRQAEFIGDPEANRLRSRAMRAPFMV